MNLPVKIISDVQAAGLIEDGDWVAIQGSGGGVGEPTKLLRALRTRFLLKAQPRDLTLLHATGLGDRNGIGTDLLAIPGLVYCDIAGHLAMAPQMAKMIVANEIQSYNFPQGVLSQMFSAIAARKPGVFTKVGLHTYIDPRLEGGRMNAVTSEDRVFVKKICGEEWLFFPRMRVDIALVRGTTANEKGNITAEEEAGLQEGIAIAQAAKACGGIVIAQVKYLTSESLDPRNVRIPGILVDFVVVDPEQKQTCLHDFHSAFVGAGPLAIHDIPPLPLDIRKVIARRAARELYAGAIVNLGVGIPSGIAAVASEMGIIDDLTFTVEHGIIGGMPASGVIFGVAYNPEAIIPQDAQFNFYDGGGLDLAFLGMAQFDTEGNVNVSKVGDMLAGCGGFINISQTAKKVVFCGSFTAKGLQCTVGGGVLLINREGQICKLVSHVDQITFSGKFAREVRQDVLFITERAVFTLSEDGVVLQEIAPGIDLEKDVLSKMEFKPLISDRLVRMDMDLFR
jgi:acyl CoA:acetate/3-ketoacid CoA transferase